MIRKRGHSFEVRIWVRDDTTPAGRRKETVGTYPTKAEARTAQAQAIIARGSQRRGRPVWTIDEFAVRWLERYHGLNTKRPVETTLAHNRDAISAFVKDFGAKKLREVEPADARDFAAEFPWRARVVKAMFADAVRDGKLTHSPFDGVSIKTGQGRRHITPLTMGEIERLAQIAEGTLGFYGPHFAAFIRIHGWVGMRPGEVCRVEWADIDWRRGRLEIPKTKTKQPRNIALAPQALDVFRSIPRLDEQVFHTARHRPMRPGSYGYFWRQVRSAFTAELPRDHWLPRRLREDLDDQLDLYECRHACASMLIAEGLTIEELAEYLGNSPEVCRSTYVHLYRDRYEDRVLAAFERIGKNFMGAQSERIGGEGSA